MTEKTANVLMTIKEFEQGFNNYYVGIHANPYAEVM